MPTVDTRHRARKRSEEAPTTRVNALRIARNLTIAQLAARTKLGKRTIDRMMAGTPVALRAYRLVARALDVDLFLLWPQLMTNDDVRGIVESARSDKRRAS